MTVRFTTVSLMTLTRPDVASVSTVTSAHLATAAEQAEALMLGWLRTKYTIPDSVSYPLLESLATDLALYRFLSRRLYVTLDAKQKSGIEALYDEATSTLSGIAAGMIPVLDASGIALAPRTDVGDVYSTTAGYEPTFHEGPIGTHVVDPDKVEAELERRDLGGLGDRLT